MASSKTNTVLRRRLVSAWISTVLSLSLVLLLVGAGTLLLINAKAVSDYFKEHLQVSVLLKEQVEEDEALAFRDQLAERPFVRSAQYISREQGVQEMSKMLGQDFLDVFESAPVPISVDVHLDARYVSADSLTVVKELLSASPLVEEVVYQTSLVDALNQNLQRISAAMLVAVLLLLFISAVLIANTVRIDLFSHRFSIHTMHLVGASTGFIRAPFVVRAALQGLFAALLASLMLVEAMFVLRREFAQLFQIFTMDSLLLTMGVMLFFGVLICTAGTFIVVSRMAGYSRDQVYSF